MSKAPKPVFVCQECGSQSSKWLGRCPDCNAWNSFVEERAVEAGAGVTALSALVVGPSLASGALHALPFDLGSRSFYGVRHKERFQSRAAEAFLAVVQDWTSARRRL